MISPRKWFPVLALLLLYTLPADAQTARTLHFTARQCNEDAIGLRLDPAPFQALLGARFSLALDEGRARVLIVAHDCAQYWMDGEDVGPTQEVQVWVLIRGAEDMRPVVGAERTLPTRTWFSLFSGCNNPRVREAKGSAGTRQLPIERITLDPPGARRGGRLVVSKDLAYSWSVASVAPSARLVGINHDVFVRDSAGNLALNRIQVIVHVSAAPSPGTLNVVGQSAALPWIPPGSYPAVIQTFFPMWSRVTLGLAPVGAEVSER